VETIDRRVLVDANVLLDILTEDAEWKEWSSARLAECANSGLLHINPIIYAEVSVGFERIEELEDSLPHSYFRREALPWEAAFLAGKCFVRYRRDGGSRRSPIPDFYIGAHAVVRRMTLLTRDPSRYRSYFPRLRLIAPSS
jgi:predicted nucleic acid-binding protein